MCLAFHFWLACPLVSEQEKKGIEKYKSNIGDVRRK